LSVSRRGKSTSRTSRSETGPTDSSGPSSASTQSTREVDERGKVPARPGERRHLVWLHTGHLQLGERAGHGAREAGEVCDGGEVVERALRPCLEDGEFVEAGALDAEGGAARARDIGDQFVCRRAGGANEKGADAGWEGGQRRTRSLTPHRGGRRGGEGGRHRGIVAGLPDVAVGDRRPAVSDRRSAFGFRLSAIGDRLSAKASRIWPVPARALPCVRLGLVAPPRSGCASPCTAWLTWRSRQVGAWRVGV